MKFNAQKVFAIMEWLPSYNADLFKSDLGAGLTVGVMLIPQGMAYSMIAGLPPIYGLYASILPLILYAIFGTSRQLAVGPVAMVSLLVAAGVGQIAESGTEAYITAAITVALLVGVIQLALGIFRLGFLVNFLSHPIISGFTSAAALIIGLSQLKHLMGVDLGKSEFIHEILIKAVENIAQTNLITLAIGAAGIAIIILVKKQFPKIPGQLVAVVFGILVVGGFGLDAQGVKILGEVPSGLPKFNTTFDFENIKALFPIALTIALIGFMESIAVAKAIQAKHKNYKIVANQELIGLGMANIGGAFFQAFPTTGGFSRTAVNDQAGAKTGMASIISAALIALTLLFLTPLFRYLPNAILASVIMVAVFGLIDFKEAKHLWHSDKTDFVTLLVTFVGTLTLGIEPGILVGVALSLALVIFKSTRPHYAVLGKIKNEPHFRNINRFPDLETSSDTLMMRFDAGLYFANVNFFKEITEKHFEEKGEALKAFFLDADNINSLDSSGAHALSDLVNDCKKQNIAFYIVGVKGPIRDILNRTGIMDKIGKQNFFLHMNKALEAYRAEEKTHYSEYAVQHTKTKVAH